MGHQPERTCIGCRGVFKKEEVIRVVAGPEGPVIDYREKLPGRAAYLCPRPECIHKALAKENLSRALRTKVKAPGAEDFLALLCAAVREKIKSLLSMAARAGKLASGYSAVEDALLKGRVEMLLFSRDISDGTKEKIERGAAALPVRRATLFTRDEMGLLFGREFVGVIGILDKGFSDAVWNETARLKGLLIAYE